MTFLQRFENTSKVQYVPLLRKDAAVMLGVASSNLSCDCKLLGFSRPKKGQALYIDELYRLWSLRVLMLITKSDRRELAVRVRGSLKDLERYMTGLGWSIAKFQECYRYYLENETCIRQNGFNREQPANLQRATEKKRWQYGHYLRRNVVAKYLEVSPATVSAYLRVLGFKAGRRICKAVFTRLLKLRTIAKHWQEVFSQYSGKKREGCFNRRFTLNLALALDSIVQARNLNVIKERESVQELISQTLSEVDSIFSELKSCAA